MEIENTIARIRSVPAEFWWRGLSYVLSAFFLVPNITLILFIIYMAEFNFFSYDFILEGVFGMKLFFLTTVLFLIFVTALLYSPIFIYVARKKKIHIDKYIYVVVAFLSVYTWLSILYKLASDGDYEKIIFIVMLCSIIAGHISVLILCNAKKQFISLAMVTGLIVFLSLNSPAQSAKVVSIGLQAFGVGGGLPITIISIQSGVISTGNVKLITPQNIYFSPSNETGIATYPLSNVNYYIVGNKIKECITSDCGVNPKNN